MQHPPPDLGTIPSIPGFPTDANEIISLATSLVLAFAGLIFFAMLVMSGFRFLTAGGDEKSIQEARKSLTNATIGLIIVVSAFAISQILFTIFGLNSLISITNNP